LVESGSSIPSRALEVWRRLYTRYSLEPFPASVSPDVLKTIIPVTQADDLLKTVVPTNALLDLNTTGHVVLYTVPQGKRATLIQMQQQEVLTAGTNLQVVLGGVTVEVSGTGTATKGLGETQAQPILMDTGDTVGAGGTANAGDASRRFSCIVLEEDTF